jgi:hypothetical protein
MLCFMTRVTLLGFFGSSVATLSLRITAKPAFQVEAMLNGRKGSRKALDCRINVNQLNVSCHILSR